MNSIISINNHQLAVKEYQGKRIVTFKDIDECHDRPDGTAKRNFNSNKHRLQNGIDYIKLSADEIRTHKIMEVSSKVREEITFITETGYMMLVKSFTDDLAWEVQRMLVNTYFQKDIVDRTKQDKLVLAKAKLMNAQARVASIWLKIGERVPNNQEYQQICNSYASEVLTGQKVLPLPECDECYYTATEVAQMVGSNNITVGKKAKAAGIRPNNETIESPYGKFFFDKSQHSNKEVSTFKYNVHGVEAIKELFGLSNATEPVMA